MVIRDPDGNELYFNYPNDPDTQAVSETASLGAPS